MGPRPLFTAFGIPVSIDPFFLFGAFIIYSISGGGREGLITVIALLAFVVLHEFGHALTARSFGATTAITITFLGGFASYATPRPLKAWQTNLISVMGPLTQFVTAIPVIVVAQQLAQGDDVANRLFGRQLYSAVAWAGILLACVNLLPLWPLDGGRLAQRTVERLVGERSMRPFLIWSIGASIALMIASFAVQNASFIAEAYARMQGGVYGNPLTGIWSIMQAVPAFIVDLFFIPLFSLLASLGQLNQHKAAQLRVHTENVPTRSQMSHAEAVRTTREAERESWASGVLGEFPKGWTPSPWLRAHLALIAGDATAGANELAALADGHPRNWLLDRADRPQVEQLLAYVPASAADGLAVLEARVHHGSAEDLVDHATRHFIEERSAEPLYLGAEGLAVRGHADEAMQWLARAVAVAPDPHRMGTATELRDLHRRSDFQQLLGDAERALGTIPR